MIFFAVLSFLTIVLACLIPAGLLYAFFHRNTKRRRNRGLLFSLTSIGLVVACVSYLLFSIARETVRIGKRAGSGLFAVAVRGLAEVMTDRAPTDSPQVKYLQSFEVDSIRGKVDIHFYTYMGFRDWWRLPIMYPYSIHCIDEVDYGALDNEKNVKDVLEGSNAERISTGIEGITHLSFDKKLLLFRTQGNSHFTKDTTAQFVLFHLTNEKMKSFSSEAELFKRADLEGFTGPKKLESLKDYLARF